ncbi:aryl-sulfate sulfotransferase [Acinetobacter larvae]|uniref:ArsR family transcriptional regulator n=1 Tax=Acinetobacter larvae TaxID=1789224 RepID=A0A1B2LVS8_9GAMM|nr:aryl-sulfate sulfotransferase [Acinetobacter larvae]AOA57040.1 ArsR family transcriptional regulator [Acinetobacter larvae]
MKKYIFALGLGLWLSNAVHSAPSVYPTGVTIYQPEKAWKHYTVFSAADQKSYLIDMNGQVVKQWPYKGFPTEVINPAVNKGALGHIFVQLKERPDKDPHAYGNGVNNHSVAELDWQGKVLWQWSGPDAASHAHQHHEIERLNNGNTLLLANKIHAIAGFKLPQLVDDVIYEVDATGQVLWQWLASEHLAELGFSPEQLKLVQQTDLADYLHLNNARSLGENPWYDAGDQRFHPDNIIIDSRQANFIAIIDKKTKQIVWRIGPNYPSAELKNPFADKSQLPRAVDQLSGLHDAKMIGKGLPGAGNILVFDNQGGSGYPAVSYQVATGASRVVEINPQSKQIVWEYRPGTSFFSAFTSLARRLPNGNTSITEGQTGRIFQITPQGEIVWEYVSPFFAEAKAGRPASNGLYRATPVAYQWVPVAPPQTDQAVRPPQLADFKVAIATEP